MGAATQLGLAAIWGWFAVFSKGRCSYLESKYLFLQVKMHSYAAFEPKMVVHKFSDAWARKVSFSGLRFSDFQKCRRAQSVKCSVI